MTDPTKLDPARTPLPLTASQEAQVRELYYKRVRGRCADEVRGMFVLDFDFDFLGGLCRFGGFEGLTGWGGGFG